MTYLSYLMTAGLPIRLLSVQHHGAESQAIVTLTFSGMERI